MASKYHGSPRVLFLPGSRDRRRLRRPRRRARLADSLLIRGRWKHQHDHQRGEPGVGPARPPVTAIPIAKWNGTPPPLKESPASSTTFTSPLATPSMTPTEYRCRRTALGNDGFIWRR